MARVLDVYLKEDLVGQLEQADSGTMRFHYHETWLGSKSAVALSASLPLISKRFGRNECRPFFAGLLPEEDSRKLIAKSFGVSDKNDFALLEKIGAECAGAVSLNEAQELIAFWEHENLLLHRNPPDFCCRVSMPGTGILRNAKQGAKRIESVVVNGRGVIGGKTFRPMLDFTLCHLPHIPLLQFRPCFEKCFDGLFAVED